MSNFGGPQGVSLIPRFIFGVNGEIRNSIAVVDDKKVLYVAGHNIVIYDPDEKS
jgi:hypothetical protein